MAGTFSGKRSFGVRINHQLEPMKLKFIYYFMHTEQAHTGTQHAALARTHTFVFLYIIIVHNKDVCVHSAPITIIA